MSYSIELTKDEADILSGIELDQSALDHEQYKTQGPLILQLLGSLLQRDAIPEVRMLYWSDPNFNVGKVKTSHKGLFERNGRQGDEIYTHPHFLTYLRYFLFGPQMPQAAISGFEAVVGDPAWVSSGDITRITKGTRSIVRAHGLKDRDEEFYRLALDLGLGQSFAKAVRDAVKQVR